MPKMRYTAEDLLRGKLIEAAGWYTLRVEGIRQEEAKTDASQNVIVDLLILNDGDYKGVPIPRYFNEKAPGFITDFAEACGTPLTKGGGNFEFDTSKGKTIDGFIEQRKDDKGNLQNSVARFRKHIVEVG